MIPKKIVPSTDRAVAFTRDDVRVGIAYAAPRRARGKALVFIGEGAVSQSA